VHDDADEQRKGSGLVFSCYITGGMAWLSAAQRIEIRRYLFGQVKSEGGWGMYVQGSCLSLCVHELVFVCLCACL
jgi:hypothetical protein